MVDVLSIAFVLLYHLKILQRIFNRYFFFFWAFRLSALLRFWLIIVFSFYNSMLLLYLCNIQIRYLHPIIMLRYVLLYLLISRLSTLRFGPCWAKVPWTFSASPQLSNPSHPYQVSHSHDVSLRGVWTKGIPFLHVVLFKILRKLHAPII